MQFSDAALAAMSADEVRELVPMETRKHYVHIGKKAPPTHPVARFFAVFAYMIWMPLVWRRAEFARDYWAWIWSTTATWETYRKKRYIEMLRDSEK